MNFYSNSSFVFQSFLAGIFTFIFTSLGASIIFLFKKVPKIVMDCMLSVSAGIMLAASLFSLINPAIEMIDSSNFFSLFILTSFFIIGGIFLLISNYLFDNKINIKSFNSNKRCIMLFFSIMLHNIPEGLVLGVAFGSVSYKSMSLMSAILLTIGIAIQNFPEGSAISLPLARDGISTKKAFMFGVLSGIVEPIAAVIGAILVLKIKSLLPFIMSFTAGAMIYVIILELIPESLQNKKEGLMTLLNMIGFSIMMFLDIFLG